MPGKLKLNVEQLEVESFAVREEPVERGTVHGFISDAPQVCVSEDASCNAMASCNGTCDHTCGDTCDHTCRYTCQFSCGRGCGGDYNWDGAGFN